MTRALHIPADEMAEAAVAAICVASDRGYRLAAERLTADDFYVPVYRRLFDAAGQLCHMDGSDEDTHEARIPAAADLASVATTWIRDLVDSRPLMFDKNGHLAARIARAAEKRRIMEAAADIFNRVGAGEDPREVLAELPVLPLLSHGRPA